MKYSLLPFMIASLCVGCDTGKHYKSLSFFFDGVPNPESEKSSSIEPVKTDKKIEDNVKPIFKSIHTPWKNRECGRCHDKGKSSSLSTSLEQLCFRCHDRQEFNGPWVHGPVSVGACLSCHQPHRSEWPKLLLYNGNDLCFQCHSPMDLSNGENHETSQRCTECHNPHRANDKYLLLSSSCP